MWSYRFRVRSALPRRVYNLQDRLRVSRGTNDSILVGIIIFIIVVIIIIIIIRCHLFHVRRTVRTTDFHVELTVELNNG